MGPIDFITLDDNLPFAVSLAVMALLGLVSVIGIDLDGADGHDGIDIPLLDWVNPGRMPMLASLTVLLCVYGLVGLIGQQTMLSMLGHTADAIPAGLATLPVAGLLSRPINRGLSRVMPRDETTAIEIAELIGRRGRIEIGTARTDHAARARFVDDHGQTHMLMVEPSNPEHQLTGEDEILLVAIVDGVGRAIAVEPRPTLTF